MDPKKRVIIDYKALEPEMLELLNHTYPYGFMNETIRFPNSKGEIITAVRLETDEFIYMVKISSKMKETFSDDELDAMVIPSEKAIKEDLEDDFSKDDSDDDEPVPEPKEADDDDDL